MAHYSQNDEQEVILEAVKDLPTGRFLDVGAYDGETFSNTLALAEMQWTGVLVEPGAIPFQKLAILYQRPERRTLIHALVGLESRDLVEFWDCGEFYSTTEQANRERFQHMAHFTKLLMPQIGIGELLHKFEPFDVVSIDTEGTSVPLFIEMLHCHEILGRPLPRVVCVEHDGQPCTVAAALRGYRPVMQNAENIVFVRP